MLQSEMTRTQPQSCWFSIMELFSPGLLNWALYQDQTFSLWLQTAKAKTKAVAGCFTDYT